jgi:hypothetical protein
MRFAWDTRYFSAHGFPRGYDACSALYFLIVLLWLGVGAAQALQFPALTGRVVDQANVIPAQNRSALEGKLRNWKTSRVFSSSSLRLRRCKEAT